MILNWNRVSNFPFRIVDISILISEGNSWLDHMGYKFQVAKEFFSCTQFWERKCDFVFLVCSNLSDKVAHRIRRSINIERIFFLNLLKEESQNREIWKQSNTIFVNLISLHTTNCNLKENPVNYYRILYKSFLSSSQP